MAYLNDGTLFACGLMVWIMGIGFCVLKDDYLTFLRWEFLDPVEFTDRLSFEKV